MMDENFNVPDTCYLEGYAFPQTKKLDFIFSQFVKDCVVGYHLVMTKKLLRKSSHRKKHFD